MNRDSEAKHTPGAARPGVVYLVGAGPGDPGLMTLRAAELVADADAILYDRLIPESALQGARADAIKEYAGKGPRGDSKLQSGIESRMVELAKQGLSVVRLKGGDPLVFGRGGEEATTLTAEGIEFEIVPGVTAGVAAAAYAGVPVTHRSHARAVAFISGNAGENTPDPTIDWSALAAFPGTLVFYMGVRNMPEITGHLIDCGRDPAEPVAVIQQGTTPAQRTVVAPLGEIAERIVEAGIQPPALTVIGSVVSEREHIQWFEHRPLLGRSVVVTRARSQAGTLGARLRELGADVIEAPAIRTEPRDDDDVRKMAERVAFGGAYDLICFTSANGVECFFEALRRAGVDARAIAGAKLAAVGRATAGALRDHGLIADFVPERATAEGLLQLLSGEDVKDMQVLCAVASAARPVLTDGLAELGAAVERVAVYDTVAEPLADATAEKIAAADFVTFASGSSVRSLVEALGGIDQLRDRKLISIGPQTSAALRESGLEPSIEATSHDVDGLIDAVIEAAG